jgi:hypothetical protein
MPINQFETRMEERPDLIGGHPGVFFAMGRSRAGTESSLFPVFFQGVSGMTAGGFTVKPVNYP